MMGGAAAWSWSGGAGRVHRLTLSGILYPYTSSQSAADDVHREQLGTASVFVMPIAIFSNHLQNAALHEGEWVYLHLDFSNL